MLLQRLFRFAVVVFLAISIPAWGQTFSSGSTGADGALNVTSGMVTVALPASGVLNYTTVNVAAGATLNFANNLANTPVIMLAQGNVTIAGTISLSANGRVAGPGGFDGGDAGYPGTAGWGPGGGAPGQCCSAPGNGQWVGPLSLFPNIGGSGGGGTYGYCGNGDGYDVGGGGGGAITIASSTSIAINGTIVANGVSVLTSWPCYYSGAVGANGAVRLVANSINVGGSVSASVFRMEAPTGSNSYTGTGTPPVIATINSKVTPSPQPTLRIVSIGGSKVPAQSGSSFTTIDLLLPNSLVDPIAVVVQASHVPVGSPVTISFSNSPNATFTPATLQGTTTSSSATLSVSSLNRSGVSYLFVMATFDASLISKSINPQDPDSVSKIEVAAAPGRESSYRFLRRDGSEVPRSRLPLDLQSAFGL